MLANGKVDRLAVRDLAGGSGPVRVFSIPMTTRFRGITVREGVLVEGAAGWGEWSPFVEYPPRGGRAWLRLRRGGGRRRLAGRRCATRCRST